MRSAFTSVYVLMLHFLELLILSRYIAVDQFGMLASCAIVLGLVALLGNGVLGQVFLRRDQARLPNTTIVMLLMAFTQWLVAVLVIFLLFDTTSYGGTLILIFFIIIGSRILYACLESIHLRNGKIQKVNTSSMLSSTLSFSCSVFLILVNWVEGFFILLISLAIKDFFSCVFLFEGKQIGGRNVSVRTQLLYYKKAFAFYWGFMSSSAFGYVLNNLDKWYINLNFGLENLGYYSRAFQLVNVPIVVLNRVASKDIQSMMLNRNDRYKYTIVILLAIAVLVSLIFYGVSFDVVNYVLGDSWGATAEIVKVLSVVVFLKVCMKIIDVYIRAYMSARDYNHYYMVQLLIFLLAWPIISPISIVEVAQVILLSSLLSVVFFAALLLKRRMT